MDFYKGGNLEKGVDLEKGRYDSPYQLCGHNMVFLQTEVIYLDTTRERLRCHEVGGGGRVNKIFKMGG